MAQKAFKEVETMFNTNPNLAKWFVAFERADRMKNVAYNLYVRGIQKEEILDSRMKRFWSEVTKYELFPTFVNGYLTDKAGYYHNGIKLLGLMKKQA